MELEKQQIAEIIIDRLSKKLSDNSRVAIQRDLKTLVNHPDYWQVRAIEGLSVKRYETFREFIIASVPWGLGWTMKVAEAFILPELPEVWSVIENDIPKANKQGRQEKESKVTCNLKIKGNDRNYSIAVLKRDAPAIADKVIAGEISAAEGMRQAGKRKPMVTHPATVDGFYNAMLSKLTHTELSEVLKALTIHENKNTNNSIKASVGFEKPSDYFLNPNQTSGNCFDMASKAPEVL